MAATRRSRVIGARFLATCLAGALFLIGCTSNAGGTTTTLALTTTTASLNPFGCVSAPEPERHSFSEFPLAITDNPTTGGSATVLRIGTPAAIDSTQDSFPDDLGLTDLGAKWQCWTGATWVETHVLMLDGDVIVGFPGATTTTLAIGRSLPGVFDVLVPNVAPGWYRIAVSTSGPEPYGTANSERSGYIAVEVIE